MSRPAHELWPPLGLIRSTFVPDEGKAVAAAGDTTSVVSVSGARGAAAPAEPASRRKGAKNLRKAGKIGACASPQELDFPRYDC